MTTNTLPSPTRPRRELPPSDLNRVPRDKFWGEVIIPLHQSGDLDMKRREGSHRWTLKETEEASQQFDFARIRKAPTAFVPIDIDGVPAFVLMDQNAQLLTDTLHRYHRRLSA